MKLEETKIISHAMRSAISFDWYLKKARKDGVIDDNERDKLERLKDRIYQDALDVAEKDDMITHDEAKLLAKLSDKLTELQDYDQIEV